MVDRFPFNRSDFSDSEYGCLNNQALTSDGPIRILYVRRTEAAHHAPGGQSVPGVVVRWKSHLFPEAQLTELCFVLRSRTEEELELLELTTVVRTALGQSHFVSNAMQNQSDLGNTGGEPQLSLDL
jgi:hypothetical protein